MKILASKQYPTYEDYVASGKFDDDQLIVLRRAFEDKNLSPRAIRFIANPQYSRLQMQTLLVACDHFPLAQVALAADPQFSAPQMYAIFAALRSGVSAEDIAKWATPECPASIMKCYAGIDTPDVDAEHKAVLKALGELDVSDYARNTILDTGAYRNFGISALNLLAKYISLGVPQKLIDSCAWGIGTPMLKYMCQLYLQYSPLFNGLDTDDFDAMSLGIDCAENIAKDIIDGKYSVYQVKVLLQSFMDVGNENMFEAEIQSVAHPEFTVDQMEEARKRACDWDPEEYI